jgi:hypothetical protein
MVTGFTLGLEKKVLCRRAQIYSNEVDTCELFDENILAGCRRFEPDEDHMRELWNHELDANAKEATLAIGIISRYVRVISLCSHS